MLIFIEISDLTVLGPPDLRSIESKSGVCGLQPKGLRTEEKSVFEMILNKEIESDRI